MLYLKHGTTLINPQILIRDLDSHGDRVIAFEAVLFKDLGARLPETRAPLQQLDENARLSPRPSPIGAKLPNNARSVSPLKAKLERSTTPKSRIYSLPLSSSPAPPAAKSNPSEDNQPSSREPRAIKAEAATAEDGGMRATDVIEHTKSQKPQFARYLEQNRARLLQEQPKTRDENQMYKAAWLEWSRLDPASRAKYYIKAEAPAEAYETPYLAGNDDVDDDEPQEEVDDTPKQFQLQTLVANAGLELLETSVERGVKLLNQLMEPMKENSEISPDAVQWIEQIEKLQKSAIKTRTIIGVGDLREQDLHFS